MDDVPEALIILLIHTHYNHVHDSPAGFTGCWESVLTITCLSCRELFPMQEDGVSAIDLQATSDRQEGITDRRSLTRDTDRQIDVRHWIMT